MTTEARGWGPDAIAVRLMGYQHGPQLHAAIVEAITAERLREAARHEALRKALLTGVEVYCPDCGWSPTSNRDGDEKCGTCAFSRAALRPEGSSNG